MTSMGVVPRGKRGLLLGVELDNELFAHGHVDLRPRWKLANRDLEAAFAGLEPGGLLAVERIDVVAHDDHRTRFVAQRDDVVFADGVARDRDATSVHCDVAMSHELAGLSTARTPAGPEDHVVEAELEQLQ